MKHTLKAAALVAAITLVAACSVRQADADPTRRPLEYATPGRVQLFVDPDTGCHYLFADVGGRPGGLTPRLTADGKILCVL